MDNPLTYNHKARSNNSRSQNSFQETLDPKMRYHIVNKQQMQIERQKAQQKEIAKKNHQQNVHKKQLLSEIAKKKKELQAIEKSQSENIYEQSEAQRSAKVKAEKDKLLKMEKDLMRQAARQQAQYRHKDALKWLEKERQDINSKIIQANSMRNTHCLVQKKERVKAEKYAKSLQQKNKELQQRSKQDTERSVNQYIKGLNMHGIHKKKLGTARSNPNIIISKQNEQEDQAVKLAAVQQEKMKEVDFKKSQQAQKNRQKALERGREALQRNKKQREYYNYCQQVEKDQINYNIQRIAAGQKNQYTGVKPMTLSQIEANKKLRGEQQFQNIFFKGKKISAKAQVVTKYGIVQEKMKEKKPPKHEEKPKQKRPINYMEQESLIPAVSEGHYSFEEEKQWSQHRQEAPAVSPPKYEKEQEPERQFEPKPIIRQSYFAQTKGNALKETRIPGQSGNRGELHYSESQEDSNI